MPDVNISWSAGIGLKAITEEGYDHLYFEQGAYEEPYQLQKDVWALATHHDIAKFKRDWHITYLKELFLGPCGHNVFWIKDEQWKDPPEPNMDEYLNKINKAVQDELS
jgi:hypothetical protein